MSRKHEEREAFSWNPVLRYTPSDHRDNMFLLEATLEGNPTEKDIVQKEIKQEEMRAQDYLLAQASPLFPPPPKERWGIVLNQQDGAAHKIVQVPFAQNEITAITIARHAYQELDFMQLTNPNTVVKEFLEESQFFPPEINTDNEKLTGMQYRAPSVWEIFKIAQAAENAMTLVDRPPNSTIPSLRIMQDLPDKLVKYPPSLRTR